MVTDLSFLEVVWSTWSAMCHCRYCVPDDIMASQTTRLSRTQLRPSQHDVCSRILDSRASPVSAGSVRFVVFLQRGVFV